MIYEKIEPKKKARWTLKIADIFRQLQADVTLDSTKKNCLEWITDGEELKNSSIFRRSQQCSSSFSCYQGQAAYAVTGKEPLAQNLRTVNVEIPAFSWSSAVQER